MNGHKILVVDDDASIRQVVSEGLFMEGFDTYTAANGKEGLDSVSKQRPDLIILDVNMPVMNGWETLKALTKIPEAKGVPVLMLTGEGEVRDIGQAAGMGATSYLIKPIDFGTLLRKIQSMLNRGGNGK